MPPAPTTKEGFAITLEPRSGKSEADAGRASGSFVTTEHFVLQSARGATVTESTARATMFLLSVSGGLVAWGLVATASRIGTAFYAFGLVLLPTLAFIGWITFERVLQTALEDYVLVRRIDLLREYYFDQDPGLASYLTAATPSQRPPTRGLLAGGRRQVLRTVAGMVAGVSAVLTGSAAGLIAVVVSHHSLTAALASGAPVTLACFAALLAFQGSAFSEAGNLSLIGSDDESSS